MPVYTVARGVQFQSTLPVGGATHLLSVRSRRCTISIHAPRGGSDRFIASSAIRRRISIHAPRGGSDQQHIQQTVHGFDFNPRSPWGERPGSPSPPILVAGFQSTLPVGGATQSIINTNQPIIISIHAPRGGSDHDAPSAHQGHLYFNPRSPWGERLVMPILRYSESLFQSTLPVGGATPQGVGFFLVFQFQSTLPVGGATFRNRQICSILYYFNPRSPWGERLCCCVVGLFLIYISIHAPRGGSDQTIGGAVRGLLDFNPRSPWGERLAAYSETVFSFRFQSTLPVGGATPMECEDAVGS